LKGQNQAAMTGSVKFYDAHLFISTPTQDWPARIEEGKGYLTSFARWIEKYSRKSEFKRVKLTAFHDPEQGRCPRILSFPDRAEYKVQVEDLEEWVRVFCGVRAKSPAFSPAQPDANWVFVCAHGTRDERCGICGPPLVGAFRKVLRELKSPTRTFVYPCSHVGGHIYAGNVLIFPSGDWYGLVTPELVPQLVDRHLVRSEVLWECWRGRVGLTPEEQRKLRESSRTRS
jgi:hypothetical protein